MNRLRIARRVCTVEHLCAELYMTASNVNPGLRTPGYIGVSALAPKSNKSIYENLTSIGKIGLLQIPGLTYSLPPNNP